ncbi:MAG: hypothetical protein GWO02_03675, partial [Gammaproteobacteria bacterium]|nr:hypothetical protein [Gammaproteobacteria bacterium]
LDDAVAQYRRAIELQPGAAIFWHNLAYSLAASSRLEDAFAVIQEAEEGGVDCRHAYARIGE